jgi:hypothetical protein
MDDIDPSVRTMVDGEMQKAKEAWNAGNDGRARACVRRAVAAAVREYERTHTPFEGRSSVDKLRSIFVQPDIPKKIREAANRLTTNVNKRLSSEFSFNPLLDGQIIISFLIGAQNETQ